MLRKLERLGTRHQGSFWDAALTEQDKLDVRYIEQVTRLAASVDGLRSPFVSGHFRRQLSWFRKRLDTLVNFTETAQSFLLEIEVGAALAMSGLHVSFEEPDLVVSGMKGLPTIAMPLKRPQSTAGVDSCARDATHQSRRRGLPGVILMCLDAVVNSDRNGEALEFWSRSHKALNDGTWRRFKETVQGLEHDIRRRSDPSVIGVLWFARMPGAVIPADTRERPLYSRRSYALASLNQDHREGTTGPLVRLLHALYRGIP
jgi:hypothetical protein